MIPDNYELWTQHDAEQQAWEEIRPVCDCCGEHIQDEHYFHVFGSNLCMSCIEDMKVRIE